MSGPERQDDGENLGTSPVFDWRTWQTWEMFLGSYIGLGLGIGVTFIAAQVLVHKLLHLEDANIKELLIDEEIRMILDKHMDNAYNEIIRLLNHKIS